MRARLWAACAVAASLSGAPPAPKRAEGAPVADVLIVGAGLAGMAAALQAAAQGAQVTVLEWSTVPGGAAIRFDAARVAALARRFHSTANIRFLPAHRVERLVIENAAVTGLEARNLREDARVVLKGRAVILATGGFTSNPSILRTYWPSGLAPESRLLLGGAWRARGQGHELASSAGAAFVRMESVWLLGEGAIDPRDTEGDRGIPLRLPRSLCLNLEGRPFLPSRATLLAQLGQSAWLVFDSESKAAFLDSLASPAERSQFGSLLSLDNPHLRSSDRLDNLAATMGISVSDFRATVEQLNRKAKDGERLEAPPFFALTLLPVATANLGGLRVNELGAVLRADSSVIRGLWAAGEAAGFGPLPPDSPEHSLGNIAEEMGRTVARAAVAVTGVHAAPPALPAPRKADDPPPIRGPQRPCFSCHDIATEVLVKRDGWWHYSQSHALVARQSLPCASCHSALPLATYAGHRHAPADLATSCVRCHAGKSPSP